MSNQEILDQNMEQQPEPPKERSAWWDLVLGIAMLVLGVARLSQGGTYGNIVGPIFLLLAAFNFYQFFRKQSN